MPNSLAQNAADLIPCLSDGLDFLLLDAETTGPGARRLRNRPVINDTQVSKDTVRQDENCIHTDLIKLSKH